MRPKTLVVYGITGSIGASTVRLLEAFPEHFTLIGASAGRNVARLNELIPRFPFLRAVAVNGGTDIALIGGPDTLRRGSGEEALYGLLDLAPDLVLMALGGKAGWKITLEALRRGIPVALANKESLVIAGYFLGTTVTRDRRRLIPVDSEHAAVMQILTGVIPSHIRRVCLTASGGALRDLSREEMLHADATMALKHPIWDMGQKVTVDSATMANKGLELIEAYWLFPLRPDQIGVLVHPEVGIHAAVELADGSWVTQVAASDMIIPIAAALAYPELLPLVEKFPHLRYTYTKPLTFQEPDLEKYVLLSCAMELLRRHDYAGMVAYAIADETAVQGFLEEKITIGGLHTVVVRSVERFHGTRPPADVEDLDAFIREVENYAKSVLHEVAR
mgnify:CR=1 FL=1